MQSLNITKDNIKGKSTETSCIENVTVEYPQISKSLLLFFCGYVIIWYLQIGYRIPTLGAIRFEFIYAALLTGCVILFTPKIDTRSPLLPYIILYFIVIVIQIPFSYDFDSSWKIFLDRIIKFAFMSFFIVSFVRSPTHMKYFLAAFLLACLKMGQEGFIGRISGSLLWENQGIMRLHGATPFYEHPNSFAGMALNTLPFVFFLWPLGNKKVKFVLFVIGVFSINIILYTGSRTGYVGMFAFILFIFYTSKNKKKFLIIFTLISIMMVPLIPSDYIGRLDSIFTQKDKEGHSTEMRIEILKDAWQIFKEHPLGVGIAAFPKVRMEKFGRSQDTHNLYLEIATNLGVQGFVIVSLFIYKMLALLSYIKSSAHNFISKLHDINDHMFLQLIDDLKLIEATALATISFIVIRLALGLFGMDLYEIYWWFAIGITLSLEAMIIKIRFATDALSQRS